MSDDDGFDYDIVGIAASLEPSLDSAVASATADRQSNGWDLQAIEPMGRTEQLVAVKLTFRRMRSSGGL